MNLIKSVVCLIITSCVLSFSAQAQKIPDYNEGLVAFVLNKETNMIKNGLQLNSVQSQAFDQITAHYLTRRMSTVGTKSQRKKELKALRKEQDQTIKSILKPTQYIKYQRFVKQKRARSYLNALRG